MIELNLLPDVKKEFIRAQRTRNTVIAAMIMATIAAGAITFLLVSFVWVVQPVYKKHQTGEIEKNTKVLKDIKDIDKYLTVQNQLNNIQGLHDEKANYSRLFGFLQQLNPAVPNNIALSSANVIEVDKMIELEGTARNFQAVNIFQNTLENAKLSYKDGDEDRDLDLFDTVTLSQAALSDNNGTVLANFKFILTYNPEVFASEINSPVVTVPNLITSDADRNAPKEVFAPQPEGVQ